MAIVEMLPPAEFALQLDNPEGDAGRAVADLLNEANYVLEIGFGNGHTVPDGKSVKQPIFSTPTSTYLRQCLRKPLVQCSAG
jgi:hypothetical protein